MAAGAGESRRNPYKLGQMLESFTDFEGACDLYIEAIKACEAEFKKYKECHVVDDDTGYYLEQFFCSTARLEELARWEIKAAQNFLKKIRDGDTMPFASEVLGRENYYKMTTKESMAMLSEVEKYMLTERLQILAQEGCIISGYWLACLRATPTEITEEIIEARATLGAVFFRESEFEVGENKTMLIRRAEELLREASAAGNINALCYLANLLAHDPDPVRVQEGLSLLYDKSTREKNVTAAVAFVSLMAEIHSVDVVLKITSGASGIEEPESLVREARAASGADSNPRSPADSMAGAGAFVDVFMGGDDALTTAEAATSDAFI